MKLGSLINYVSCEKVILEHEWEYLPNRITSGYIHTFIDTIDYKYYNRDVTYINCEDSETIRIGIGRNDKCIFPSYCYPLFDDCSDYRAKVLGGNL